VALSQLTVAELLAALAAREPARGRQRRFHGSFEYSQDYRKLIYRDQRDDL
jgi:hypothetical protein